MNENYCSSVARTFWVFLGAVFFVLLPMSVRAHGSVSIDEDKCKLFIGNYSMHFTGYQAKVTEDDLLHAGRVPPTDGADRKEFCHDIPGLGYTVVVLDAVDPELREIPLEVRIVRDTGDLSNLEAITVFHIPPKTYPAGTVTIRHTFDAPGKFVGIVRAGDGKKIPEARFPFAVARTPSPLARYIPFLAIILIGAALYWYSNRRYTAAQRRKALSSGRSVSDA